MKPSDIVAARKSLGLSQAAAAKLLGVSKSTWAHWEQGVQQPEGPALKLIGMLPTLAKLSR